MFAVCAVKRVFDKTVYGAGAYHASANYYNVLDVMWSAVHRADGGYDFYIYV